MANHEPPASAPAGPRRPSSPTTNSRHVPPALPQGSSPAQVVVVSGGGSGIGRATAWLAARLGAHVIITGRTADEA